MLDNSDLEAAVRSGVLTEEAANRLRGFSAERRGAPAADEEHLSFTIGLADAMSAVGAILLAGTALVVLALFTPLAALLLVPASWALAEHFTRKRRLMLTSLVLFGLFVIAVAMTCLAVALMLPLPGMPLGPGLAATPAALPPLAGLVVAFGSMLACILWWLRFGLPIAYAAAAIAGINVVIHILRMLAPDAPTEVVSCVLLLSGLVLLAVALGWDLSDVRRETARANVAFWLHAAAGFQLAGATYRLIFGVGGNPAGWERLYVFSAMPPDDSAALMALLVFACFVMLALAIDRRSLLMSSLAFILPAMTRMTGLPGPIALPVGAMLLGAVLLCLSAVWSRARVAVLTLLPVRVRAQLPRTELGYRRSRPVR